MKTLQKYQVFRSVLRSQLCIQPVLQKCKKQRFYLGPFNSGKLPVRYLGLPLLTKKMTVNDYMPLVEKIRRKMKLWTWRYLSHGGRLQLISSVITSLANFWLQAFQLPRRCLRDIESLSSAFLWSGPELKPVRLR